MRRFTPFLVAAVLVGAAPTAALAQVGAPARVPSGASLAQVSVRLGPELQGMADRYGVRELQDLSAVLQRRVALSAARGGFVRADIVLEDARPNRPTFAMQSVNVDLSMRSIALGGARITGRVYRADGTSEPLTYSYFETDLREDRGATTWYDAERAFDYLGDDLARGRVSHRLGPGGSPGPYHCRGALDAFCTGY